MDANEDFSIIIWTSKLKTRQAYLLKKYEDRDLICQKKESS